MPRPPRCRRICGAPQIDTFCPNGCENTKPILLTLDEYEVIRLVDLEQQTHEQCAAQMDISRSTVQEIYEVARRKIAACLATLCHIVADDPRVHRLSDLCRAGCFRAVTDHTGNNGDRIDHGVDHLIIGRSGEIRDPRSGTRARADCAAVSG